MENVWYNCNQEIYDKITSNLIFWLKSSQGLEDFLRGVEWVRGLFLISLVLGKICKLSHAKLGLFCIV